jgi:hypothetical protein
MFGRDQVLQERARRAHLASVPHAGRVATWRALSGSLAGGPAVRGPAGPRGWRAVAVLGLLLGAWLGPVAGARAEEPAREARASVGVAGAPGYAVAAPLGFRLVDTRVDEQVYRRTDGVGDGVAWSMAFTSRWALTADQLDRWSAQAITLLAEGLGTDVQLGPYERLEPADVGELRVGYRYQLLSAAGARVGEAALVLFARGAEVGVSGAATTGTLTPLDAVALARALDGELSQRSLVARAN